MCGMKIVRKKLFLYVIKHLFVNYGFECGKVVLT